LPRFDSYHNYLQLVPSDLRDERRPRLVVRITVITVDGGDVAVRVRVDPVRGQVAAVGVLDGLPQVLQAHDPHQLPDGGHVGVVDPHHREQRVDLEEGRPFDQLEGGGVDVARGEVYRQLHLLILPAPLVLGGHVADALPRLQKQSLQNGRALGCKSGGAGAKGVPRVRRAFSSP
jgi:hypothetical protein